ncbi:alpha/beta hydrolase [Streptomyces gibsoniae]|uniref:Alpha/beta hydrolase n=1 Tax=Streptomyces gibsoniae TaxID=3075529 RepID=A0ABU2TZA2_9ACTN|nr:alpha/beta hydrolase [Streptomyces sp. DSM 41699]MDT0466210.1 alpha/beta hydrolase [Streptomyces sp. DSM 41699]
MSHGRLHRAARWSALAAVSTLIVGSAVTAEALSSPTDRTDDANNPARHNPVVLEHDAQEFVTAAAKNPPIYTLSYSDARKALDDAQSGPVALPPADVAHRVLPVGPTGSVTVRIVRPKGVTGKLPAVMYIHGGGWVLGDEHTHDRLVRETANRARAAVIFVDYTPSPEARYPVAIEQAYAATQWVARHGSEIDVDGSRIAIAGDSVGGNMSAALTLMAKERGGPHLAGQALLYPVTDANFNTASYRQFADGPWLTRKAMQWFWNAYAPDAATRKQVRASPLRAGLNQLKGLPKALVVTDEADVLRDEGEEYAAKLRAAGNDVAAVRYEGTIHDFAMLNALAKTNAAQAAVEQAGGFLRTVLHSGS